ncbi:MAG: antibiotic biosynthesis monooxygenase [Deltaproteobacteria bacterium]|jgi:heme-degrading monooxygenase HmoA|nr:antibiotic biosynthesis monooxygenase [Deltaproteobacteria bacterium]MDP6244933.1 antibiotic biosynthesis monooxygenase [Myxococcota bacterium]
MVIAVFRSSLRPGCEKEFQQLGTRMLDLAQSMPGFISYKVYVSDDGERCSVIEFDSADDLAAWRDRPEHLAAQQTGRERYYEEYSLVVADARRSSSFSR